MAEHTRAGAGTRPIASGAASGTTSTRRRPAFGPGARIALLAVVAAGVLALYLFHDLPARWQYPLDLRGRTLAGMLLVAVAVGVSTVLFQTITANRILTPGIMGFDAVFMAIQVFTVFALGPVVLVATPPLVSWGVELVLMSGFVVGLYWWLFMGRRLDLHVIVLAGLVLGTVFRSITAFLQRLLDPDTFAIVQNLAFASFTSVDRTLLLPTAVLVLAALASLWPIRHDLDVLGLGEAPAIGLGVEHRRVVMHVIVVVAVLVGASTALVGPVMFFGLLVANVAYTMVGHRHLRSLPAAVLIGLIALVGGQWFLDRVLGFATELPVVIEFLGGVVFIALVLAGRAR